MNPKISVNIGKLKLKNPVMVASGTFGYAEEFSDLLDLKKLGAVVSKTITLNPRQGNPGPRTCETPAGMLNSIGLENPGVDKFIKEKLPVLKKIGIPIVVSIASEGGIEEFIQLAKRLDGVREIQAIELNVSCPNVHRCEAKRSLPEGDAERMGAKRSEASLKGTQSAKLISQDPLATHETVKAVRRVTTKTLITKLSPNVADIAEIALAAEEAGSDAIALINTLTGMSIDIETREPKVASVTAGLSGPAIRPVAVRMVWEASKKIKIPIIGMGGIMDASSSLEFIIAGATAISVGTANFINPGVTQEIIGGIKRYLVKNKIEDIRTLIGSLKI